MSVSEKAARNRVVFGTVTERQDHIHTLLSVGGQWTVQDLVDHSGFPVEIVGASLGALKKRGKVRRIHEKPARWEAT